jgi:hypothetical protein
MKKIEASVNDQIKFAKFVKELDKLDREDMHEIAVDLARLALVMQPAALRWAANEAGHNLGGM